MYARHGDLLVILDIDRFPAYSGPRLRSCLQTSSVIFKTFNFALLNYLGVSFQKYRDIKPETAMAPPLAGIRVVELAGLAPGESTD